MSLASFFFRGSRSKALRQTLLRSYAYLSAELPAINASCLFENAQLPGVPDGLTMPCVHMTAVDPLVGRTHYRELRSFVRRNEGYSFYFWNDQLVDAFMEQYFSNHKIYSVYKASKHGIIRSDIFRLCVLKICGGFYFDIKSQFMKPLANLRLEKGKLYLISEPYVLNMKVKNYRYGIQGGLLQTGLWERFLNPN